MPGFQFRLEKALKYISSKEKKKLLELGSIRKSVDRLMIRREQVQSSLMMELGKNQNVTLSPEWLSLRSKFIDVYSDDKKKIESDIKKFESIMDEKKHELNAICMQRKALEKLKEKKQTLYRKKISKIEQKRLEEMFLNFSAVEK